MEESDGILEWDEVRLNPQQMRVARALGERRQKARWQAGSRGTNNAPNDWTNALAMHVKGAPGEYAYWAWVFYRRAGIRIPRCATPRAVEQPRWASRWRGDFDFFPDIDVKTVDHPRGRLIVQGNAPDGWRFVLVDGSAAPIYKMIGWIWGSDAKQPMWWWDPTGQNRWAHFVPRLALRGMQEWRYQHPWDMVLGASGATTRLECA